MKNNKTSLVKLLLSAPLCVITLLGTGCASEETGQQIASADSERVCRTASSSGSKMRRSICRTAEEWQEIDRKARADQTTRDDFFRRARESGAMGTATSSSSGGGPGL
jgi:hypothetical protein